MHSVFSECPRSLRPDDSEVRLKLGWIYPALAVKSVDEPRSRGAPLSLNKGRQLSTALALLPLAPTSVLIPCLRAAMDP